MFSTGQSINERYELKKLLGKGGFSVVWLAEDTLTETRVAIKIYAPDKGLDKDGLAQFKKEFKRTRNLRHPHLLVPDHFDVLEGTQSPFLIMPYCPGGSLATKISEESVFSEQELARLIKQIGNGLAELHAAKIIHQDIKPDNILIGTAGKYQLTDFGISRQMRSTLKKATANQSYMTVAYAPPERYTANPVDTPAGDIFSLGVMLYELCSGSVPWDGTGGMVLNTGAEIPNLPDEYSNRLNTLVKSCMNKNYKERPSALQLKKWGNTFISQKSWPEIPTVRQDTEADTIRKTQKMEPPVNQPPDVTQKDEKSGHEYEKINLKRISDSKDQKDKTKKPVFWSIAAAIFISILIAGTIYYYSIPTRYEEKISEADKLFQAEEYEEALDTYSMALTFSSSNKNYAIEQISKINNRIYRKHVEAGDQYFDSGEYEEAIASYNMALEYKSDDSYAEQRITESNEMIEEEASRQEQRQREKLYSNHRQQADNHFNAGDFEEAIADYKKALEYKPGDWYATNQIKKSEGFLPLKYYNNFTSEGNKFRNYQSDNVTWVNEGGYLKGFSNSDKFVYNKLGFFSRLQDAKKFEISVQVRHISGEKGYPLGVVFAGKGSDPSKRFAISGSGDYYNVGKLENKNWDTEWIKTEEAYGSGNWNILKIAYNGFQFIYYINGTEVHREKAEIFGQSVGVYFSGQMEEAWFDDLRINATYQ